MADKKISFKIWLLAICLIGILSPVKALAADMQTADASAGIIEVQSGFMDEAGRFWKMKSASGFLIANKENGTYIITNCATVSNTPRSIKKFCKKNAINTENSHFSNYIQIMIEGDVAAQAEVVVKSAEKDYCVLSAANVVSQKEPLKLADSTAIAVNDPVYAWGIAADNGAGQEASQSARMARPVQGMVTEKETYLEGGIFISHSAPVDRGYTGGALLDAQGYVVGLCCRQSPEEDTGVSFALPINEISAVLDNFSIYYGSKAIDEAYAQLETARQECTEISAQGGYKKASVETLEGALKAAAQALEQEEPTAAGLTEAYQALAAARDGLVAKAKTLSITIRILPALILVLFIWAIVLTIKNAKEKKQMNVPQQAGNLPGQPQMQGAGYAGAGYANRPDIQRGGYPGQDGMQRGGYANLGDMQRGGYANPGDAQSAGYPNSDDMQRGGYPNPGDAQRGGYTNPGDVQRGGYPNPGDAQRGGYPNAGDAQRGNYPNPGDAQRGGYANQGPQRSTPYANQQQAAYANRPAVPPAGRRLRMIRQKTGEMITVNKTQFVLGKSQTQADFAVADNQTVSRKHAMLFESNGRWYVDDLNSLNGTYVNGKKLTAGHAAALQDGDEIMLSDESFLIQG